MAQTLGVRVETVHLWETGRARPLPRHHGAILRFLGYDPEPVDPSPAGRLRARRLTLGLTQAELASRLGVDEGTVVDLEHGRRRVSRRVIALIERFLVDAGGG